MPPLRLLFIVLLLLNLLALAAGLGWLGSSVPRGEPERLTNQIDPNRIQLQAAVIGHDSSQRHTSAPPTSESSEAPRTEQAEISRAAPAMAPSPPTPEPATAPSTATYPAAATADPSPLADATAPPDVPRETVLQAPPVVSEPPAQTASVTPPKDQARVCIALAKLTEAQLATLRRMAQDADPRIAITATVTDPPEAWWVVIPPTGSQQAAERRAAQLRAQGIDDLFIIRAEGPTQYAISLGIFRTEARARQHFSDLEARRVRGAEIAPRTPALYQADIVGPASLIDALSRQIADRFDDVAISECRQ